jgi:hypothetical protein
MEATMAEPNRRPFRHASGRIDWKEVALLLSMGCGLHEAALVAGCPVDRIRRNLRRSRRFRFWIEDAAAAARAKARVQLGQAMHRAAPRPSRAEASGFLRKTKAVPIQESGRERRGTGFELADHGIDLAFSRTERG